MMKHLSTFYCVLLLAIPASAFARMQNFHEVTVSYKAYATATSAWRVNKKERTETVSFTEPELQIFNERGQAVLVVTATKRIADSLKHMSGNLRALTLVPGEPTLDNELQITRTASGKTFDTASLMKPAYTAVLYVLPPGMCGPCAEMSSLMKQQAALARNARVNFVQITIAM